MLGLTRERYLTENFLPLGLCPGPSQPKDLDSFLIPFIDELKLLDKGVLAYDALLQWPFLLKAPAWSLNSLSRERRQCLSHMQTRREAIRQSLPKQQTNSVRSPLITIHPVLQQSFFDGLQLPASIFPNSIFGRLTPTMQMPIRAFQLGLVSREFSPVRFP